MAAAVRIRVTSALAVDLDGRALERRALGSRKERTLLGLLAAERGQLVALDRIVDALWPEGPPADPGANVATLVSRLRRRLGPDSLAASGRTYGLTGTGACVVDLDEAAALCDEAEARLTAGERGVAAAAARQALALLGTQAALTDEGDADWVLGVRREADALRRRARHVLSRAAARLDPAEAVDVATDAVAADPYDERAVRDLMRVLVEDGRAAAALASYDALAARLRDDLGTDPDQVTRDAQLATLRGEPVPDEDVPARPRKRPTLIGRDGEVDVVDHAWQQACAGAGSLLLLEGEPGIGKTRLLDAAEDLVGRSGALVLRARCHPTERSLFLQPYVDALRPLLLDLPAPALGDLVRGHGATWATLVPEIGELVASTPEPPASPALQQRRAFDAVADALARLSRQRPVLLTVDDLQYGGAATVDLLGYLAGRLAGVRVLLVGAVRTEDAATVGQLVGRATRVPLAALPRSAVEALASAAGLSVHGATVMARTAGHPLSVVECLRALAAGDEGVPQSLSAAVLGRLDRLSPEQRTLVEAASVLGRRLDPRVLADLVSTTELAAVQHCEELSRVRLLERSGPQYEFANDLTQECVHASLAPALVVAYHRRAADLFAHQPEVMAAHAIAAGDPERAAQGWLAAGREAMSRSAVQDAQGLFDKALAVAVDPSLRARILLARARTHEARTAYDAALVDVDAALLLARGTGDPRLEMAALRARGGDITVALHQPTSQTAACLEEGLRIASGLGDRRAESDFAGRLAILEASTLSFGPALERARRNLARCRDSASPEAVLLGLDGVKSILTALGDADALAVVVEELEPMLRQRRATWLLQWTVYESAFVPAATGDWALARSRVDDAIELNRRSGYGAYAGFFRAHGAWFDRLAGDAERALAEGLRAVDQTSMIDHPWWYAAAAGLYAGSLIEAGRTSEAAEVARAGLSATTDRSAEAWRLRCLAPLALASGDDLVLADATRLVESIQAPPGGAWIAGSDAYLLVARAWAPTDPDRAARVLQPLLDATREGWAPVRERAEQVRAQIRSTTSRAARAAPSVGTGT